MAHARNQGSGHRSGDAAVVDLLRVEGAMGIGQLSAALGVTATAVRQRLERLMRQGLVDRQALGGRRGRPAHAYSLTESGRRMCGDNFRDLALVLWREIRGVRDLDVRRGLMGRIGTALAAQYRDAILGARPADRLRDVAELMQRRQIACAVETSTGSASGLAVLTSHACPYPDLAEEDRGICAAERSMIEELVGGRIALTECRLDGASCCKFSLVGSEDRPPHAPAGESRGLQTSP